MSPAVLIAILVACVVAGIVTQRLGSKEAPARRRTGKSPAKPDAEEPMKSSAAKEYVFALRDGSRAALLPFGHVHGRGAPAAMVGQMLDADRVLVDDARCIAIDLRRLVRVMPHVINELRLSATSAAAALEGAAIEIVDDVPEWIARNAIHAKDLHLPAAWLEGAGKVSPSTAVPRSPVVTFALRFERVAIQLYGLRSKFLERVRHAQDMDGPVAELARKLGRDPILDEGSPAVFVARVTVGSEGSDQLFAGDLSGEELDALAAATSQPDDASLARLLSDEGARSRRSSKGP